MTGTIILSTIRVLKPGRLCYRPVGATLQHHFNKQSQAYEETIESFEENTYMDNLMKTGSDVRELRRFKEEAIEILQNAKFPMHKWESDIQELDKEPNPSKKQCTWSHVGQKKGYTRDSSKDE